MYAGPDVTKPSVMGAVLSHDEVATRYAALIEIQQPQVEIIESLQQMMDQAPTGRQFIEFQKIPPRRVIFFQDGVSEGEYNTMASAELEVIRKVGNGML